MSETINSNMSLDNDVSTKQLQTQKSDHKMKIVWVNVLIFVYFYFSGCYGLYLMCFEAKIFTIVWCIIHAVFAMLGITAGTHRLWTHRSYKAKWPLRVFLMILQSSANQNSIYIWCRDHRLHHKFIDTNADPYNAKRGLFFSHVGWLLMRKHPDIKAKGSKIDFSDLEGDPVVAFQKRWYNILMPICTFILPTLIPYWFWGETLWCAWFINMCRYSMNLNSTFMVNSVAHKWGMKPYDKTITPTDNIGAVLVTLGDGWHNYHHTFPWDYRSSEFGNFNFITTFIDFFAFLGLAYDLKTTSVDMIKQRIIRNNEIGYIN